MGASLIGIYSVTIIKHAIIFNVTVNTYILICFFNNRSEHGFVKRYLSRHPLLINTYQDTHRYLLVLTYQDTHSIFIGCIYWTSSPSLTSIIHRSNFPT